MSLPAQASRWCDRLNGKVHRTTRKVPLDLWVEEGLSALPTDYAWERFGTEERRVSLDGFISYDGVRDALTCTSTSGGVNGFSAGTRARPEDLSPRQPDCDAAEAASFARCSSFIPTNFAMWLPSHPCGRAKNHWGTRCRLLLSPSDRELAYDQLFGVEVSQ
jgi:hypothetical protein